MCSWLDNTELDRIPDQDGLSLDQQPKDQYQPRLQSHLAWAKTWQIQVLTPRILPNYPGAGPERWRKKKKVLRGYTADTIAATPCARGFGTGHIACEIARLLNHWESTSGPRPPGEHPPSGAQNGVSFDKWPRGMDPRDRTRCRVVLCRVFCPECPILR